MAMTKEERAEYMKKYRKEHREQINANQRYYYKHRKEELIEKNRKRSKEYYYANKEKQSEYMKKYYAEHKDDPEFMKQKRRTFERWLNNNRDRYNAYQREYQRECHRKRKALEVQG